MNSGLQRQNTRIGKIYTTGLVPAVAFGTLVNGVSDAELLALRRTVLHAKPLARTRRGVSLTFRLALAMRCGKLH